MTTLTLHEWSTASAVRLTATQCRALRTVFKAVVQPAAGREGYYDIASTGTVGALHTGDTTIVVTPKLPIARLLFLLGYAASPTFQPEDADVGTLPDLVNGVTHLFTRQTERAIQRGVLRGYRTIDADLHTVRGRINLAEQLRRRPGIDLPLAVRFQEHDEDVTENQLLLAAITLLRQLGTRDTGARSSLHRLTYLLQNVATVHFSPSDVPAIVWTRLNQHLQPAVELARLILRMQSPDIRTGTTTIPALTIDMAALFETFVRTAMREALGFDQHQFPAGSNCPPLYLDSRHQVRLEPDLSYWPGSTCAYVGDVKYKRDSGSGHSADLYQMLAYATAAGLPEATLVYAFGPPTTRRTHNIPGANIELHIEHLDLNTPPAALLQQVGDLTHRVLVGSTLPGR